jgi:apolipoprotein N-acyltransferase
MAVAEYRVLPAAWSAVGPAVGVGSFMVGYFGGLFPGRAAWYMKALPLLVAVFIYGARRGERARRERTGYALLPLLGATTWVGLELVRLPLLGTWGFFGYALYRQAWLLQPVRWVGIFGLDLLIVLVNYAIALLVIARLDRGRVFDTPRPVVPRHAVFWCAGVFLSLGVWCVLSLGLISSAGNAPLVRVAVLQPGVRRNAGATPETRDRTTLDRLAAQTQAAARRGARLVVWPEAALGADPAIAYARELTDLARTSGARLVVGYGISTPAGRRNEVITVDPNGQFLGRYGKDHPVGFLGGTSVWRGTYPTVDTPFGRIGTIICYDMDFTDSARELARRGAKIIAVPSADWPAIATKHYTFAVFRALETGAAVAKSEYSLDSAIVDGYGRIAASAITPAGSEAVLVADVALRDGVPLAARLGDWVGWLCLAAMSGEMLSRLWGRIRVRPALHPLATP